MQRLRYIHQVDLASLVFPSANHNRFEHSLGVVAVANKMLSSIQGKDIKLISNDDIMNVRMAALLHDCGHGPFSHMSEDNYRKCQDMIEALKEEKFHDRAPHEVLSYLIVTSDPFREFLEKKINPTYGLKLDPDRIGEMIIGWISDPEKAFLVDMINGPFDADKLDYILRDSHFTGIKLVLDLDRLFYTVCTVKDEQGRTRLSVDSTGVSTLEQIVFSKMMLYTTVYHHHKVRSAECVFRSIIEKIRKDQISLSNGHKLTSASDFLYYVDNDFYGFSSFSKEIEEKIKMLRFRSLYKRALVISKNTIEKSTINNWNQITKLYEMPDKLYKLREAIYEKVKDSCDCSIEDIWVDIPKPPSFKEGSECLIKLAGTTKTIRLRDVFPIDEWTTAFTENKYQGFVFSTNRIRENVHKAAKEVFKDIFDVEFNENAYILCQMDTNE